MVRTSRLLATPVCFGAACFAYRYLTFRGFNNDHYEHLVRGQQILLGDLPNRDFFEQGLPLMDLASAVPQALLGRTLMSEAILVFGAFAAAAALTCWMLLRLTGSYPLACLMATLQILVMPRSYSYPKLLLYPIALLAIDSYVRSPATTRMVILAAVTVISFLMRHDHGLFIGAGCALAIIARHWRDGLPRVARAASMYALVVVAMVLPFLIYIQWAVGVRAYVREAVAYSVAEARTRYVVVPTFSFDARTALVVQERMPTIYIRWSQGVNDTERAALERAFDLTPDQFEGRRTWRYRVRDVSPMAIERIVSHASVEDTEGIDRALYRVERSRFADACTLCLAAGPGLHAAKNAEVWLYYLAWAAVLGGLVLAVRGDIPTAPATLAGLTLMTGLAAASFSRVSLAVRLPDVWGLLPILLGVVAAHEWNSARWRYSRRVLVVVVLTLTTASVALIGNVREEFNVTGILAGGSAVRQRLERVTAELFDAPGHADKGLNRAATIQDYVFSCTTPSDRLLVFGYLPELFYQTRRGFAAGYVVFIKGFQNSDIEQRIALARWRAQSVPLVIAYERELKEMAGFFPLIVSEIHARYVPAFDLPPIDDRGRLLVFAEHGRESTGVYRPFGAACFAPAPLPVRS